MKKAILFICLIASSLLVKTQNPNQIICLPEEASAEWIQQRAEITKNPVNEKTVSDIKHIRINYHFMLKGDGTGNFTETTDGDGRPYSGYDFARDITSWLNLYSTPNVQMNIPTGNTTPVLAKNYYYTTDAVYFWRNDNTYNFQTINYGTQGKDKDSVMNIFLSGSGGSGGYASSLSPFSKVKYTENTGFWTGYKDKMLTYTGPMPFWYHGYGSQIAHEMGHLLGLSHTVLYNWATLCPVNCPLAPDPINTACDDGCADTPTAWSITQANGCTRHPGNCGWNNGSLTDCSNNLMEYHGDFALTPCQLGIIHTGLEGGMKSYTVCAAVSMNRNYCDVGYPRVSYYGANLSIGNCGALADVTTKEKLQAYFSNQLELTNFEVVSDAEFEVFSYPVCPF